MFSLSEWDCGAPPVIANAYIDFSREEELPANRYIFLRNRLGGKS
jgi:hypothetical protein